MQRQAVIIRRFIEADPGRSAAAVIPQHQHVAIRRMLPHAGPIQHFQIVKPAVGNGEAIQRVGRQVAVVPFRRAARLHCHGDLVGIIAGAHFVHIFDAGTLQIGAAHIHQYGRGGLCVGRREKGEGHQQRQQKQNRFFHRGTSLTFFPL